MARTEQDRENLLRDATAFVERIELSVPSASCSAKGNDSTTGKAKVVFVGFRDSGAGSIYFESEPVYHFNSDGQLRRAFIGALLYKAERGGLIAMERSRTDQQTTLASRKLPENEVGELLGQCAEQIRSVLKAIEAGEVEVRGAVPDAALVLKRVQERLPDWANASVAQSARVQ